MVTEDVTPDTLLGAVRYFADVETSIAFVAALRWPDGVICPACGADKDACYRLSTRALWKCRACKKQFSVKVGTIFEDSPLGLDKWLPAAWLIAHSKNGISSHELGRSLGITQKSAWFVLHRIRLAMQTGSLNEFAGEIEVDETYVGGKATKMHKSIPREEDHGHGGTQQGEGPRDDRAWREDPRTPRFRA